MKTHIYYFTCPGSVRCWQDGSLIRSVESQDAVDAERRLSGHRAVLMHADCERSHLEIESSSSAVIWTLEVRLYSSTLPETSLIKAWDWMFYMRIAGPLHGAAGNSGSKWGLPTCYLLETLNPLKLLLNGTKHGWCAILFTHQVEN